MTPPTPSESTRRWTLLAAVGVVLAVVASVVAFGIQTYPSLPTVAQMTDPVLTARLAVLGSGRDGPCVTLVDQMGRSEEIFCATRGEMVEPFGVVWEDDTHLRLPSLRGSSGQDLLLDVSDGSTSFAPPTAPQTGLPLPPGLPDDLVLGRDGDAVWLDVIAEDGGRTRAVSLPTPGRYSFIDASWSSDRAWIVVHDSADRLIVVSADGSSSPRFWFEGEVAGFAVS